MTFGLRNAFRVGGVLLVMGAVFTMTGLATLRATNTERETLDEVMQQEAINDSGAAWSCALDGDCAAGADDAPTDTEIAAAQLDSSASTWQAVSTVAAILSVAGAATMFVCWTAARSTPEATGVLADPVERRECPDARTRLVRLDHLHRSNLISDDEYVAQKERLSVSDIQTSQANKGT